MSGGHFNYQQYIMDDVADEIENIIKNPDNHEWYKFSENTLAEFKIAVALLRKARIYVQRIDYLVSGDDGEETFHSRLEEELKDL